MTALVTVAGVELVKVGTWATSSGPWTVSTDDLHAAVAAHRAGVLRRPVVKIGHRDERFAVGDGEPSLGQVENLRVVDGGQVLVGDLVNVPDWLATAMPSAYPDRSVEAMQGYLSPTGTWHPLVLTAVSLLGVTAPGIPTLRSLADLGARYGTPVAASADAGRVVHLVTASAAPDPAVRRRVVVRAAGARRRARRAEILLSAIAAGVHTPNGV